MKSAFDFMESPLVLWVSQKKNSKLENLLISWSIFLIKPFQFILIFFKGQEHLESNQSRVRQIP